MNHIPALIHKALEKLPFFEYKEDLTEGVLKTISVSLPKDHQVNLEKFNVDWKALCQNMMLTELIHGLVKSTRQMAVDKAMCSSELKAFAIAGPRVIVALKDRPGFIIEEQHESQTLTIRPVGKIEGCQLFEDTSVMWPETTVLTFDKTPILRFSCTEETELSEDETVTLKFIAKILQNSESQTYVWNIPPEWLDNV